MLQLTIGSKADVSFSQNTVVVRNLLLSIFHSKKRWSSFWNFFRAGSLKSDSASGFEMLLLMRQFIINSYKLFLARIA
jgi:hypothetical protein